MATRKYTYEYCYGLDSYLKQHYTQKRVYINAPRLCGMGVHALFRIKKYKPFDLCVSTRKPRHDNYYTVYVKSYSRALRFDEEGMRSKAIMMYVSMDDEVKNLYRRLGKKYSDRVYLWVEQ